MSSIDTFTASIVDISTITLNWTGTYDTVTIENSLNNSSFSTTISNYTDSSITVWGLSSNTLYYFRITPYDSSLTEGTQVTTFETTPFIPSITSFYSGTTTSSSIPLYWSGDFYKVAIYYKQGVKTTYTYLTTVTGLNSYTVTNLFTDTSYNFYIIPYNLNDETYSESSVITAYTDYIAKINTLYLANTTSSTIDLSWNGEFSFVKVQKSSDGGVHFKTDTKLIVYDSSLSNISSSGYCSITELSPYTTYYFRLVPYSENYNVGNISSVISAKTLMGITKFSYSYIGVDYVILTWTGVYTSIKIMKTLNNNTVTVSPTITNSTTDVTTDSQTVSSLLPYTTYSFTLHPYNGTTVVTSSSTITIITDFSAQINPYIDNDNKTDSIIPIVFDTSNTTYPYYSHVLIEASTDEGTTYTDISLISHTTSSTSPYTYNIGETSNLTGNTSYYLRLTPLSLYDVYGTIKYLNTYTLSNILTELLYINSDGNIQIDYTGNYTLIVVFYGETYYSDVSYSYYTSNRPISSTSIIFDSTYISNFNTPYFFCSINYNYLNENGETPAILYHPVISYFDLSNISTSSITLNWTGYYDSITIQSASVTEFIDYVPTEPTYYTDISAATLLRVDNTIGTANNSSITLNYDNECNFYRIIAYYTAYNGMDISGKVMSGIYVPMITSITTETISQFDLSLSWNGYFSYVDIKYAICNNNSTIPTTFYDLITNSSSYSTTIDSFDLSSNSYNFYIIPYSSGINATSSGIWKYTYNAIITSLDASASENYSINTVLLSFSGHYLQSYIYYKKVDNDYTTDYVEVQSSDTSVSITGLTTNTTYIFKIIPYNNNYEAGLTSQETSVTTRSMLSYIDLSYSSENSTSTSVYFDWKNINYDYIDIYSDGTYLARFYSTNDNYYNSSSYETLSADTEYTYTIQMYDTIGSNESTSFTTYTLASTTDLGLTTSLYSSGKGISFSWTSTGYTTFYVQNTSIDLSAITYSKTDTSYYDSSSNENVDFLQNTYYTYEFSAANSQGVISTRTETIATAATVGFTVESTTSSSITLRVYGYYSGFVLYMGITSTDLSNTIIMSNIISATSAATSILYYYPLTADLYDYSSGYGSSAMEATAYNGAALSSDDSQIGTNSLYLSSSLSQYLTLPLVLNTDTTSMTWSCWIKSNYSDSNAKVFSFISSDTTTELYCSINDSYTSGKTTINYKYENSYGSTTTETALIGSCNDNTWYHLAVVFDSNNSEWITYLNGNAVTTLSTTSYPYFDSTFTNYIGKSGANLTDGYFNGYIEDFRLYSYALTSTEIGDLYEMGSYLLTLDSTNSIVDSADTTYYIKIAAINGDGVYSALSTTTTSVTTAS